MPSTTELKWVNSPVKPSKFYSGKFRLLLVCYIFSVSLFCCSISIAVLIQLLRLRKTKFCTSYLTSNLFCSPEISMATDRGIHRTLILIRVSTPLLHPLSVLQTSNMPTNSTCNHFTSNLAFLICNLSISAPRVI